MKRALYIFVLLTAGVSVAAEAPWQYGRISDVSKSVTTKTKAWVVNTPITEDEISYTTNYPVKVQLVGDRIYLRAPTGDLRLHVVRRKNARMMAPLTLDEKKRLEQIEAPAGSLVGFSEDAKSAGGGTAAKAQSGESAPPPAPVALPPTMGTVQVRSTPYLSEVFVDGDSMGYTPAKVSLPPGKHAFRVEKAGYKAWTKEIMITVGSELTLDASLDKK
jgi:hypothetical protein